MLTQLTLLLLLCGCSLAQTLTCASGMSPADLIQTGYSLDIQAQLPPSPHPSPTATASTPSSSQSTSTSCLPPASRSPPVTLTLCSLEPIPVRAEQDPEWLWLRGGGIPHPGRSVSADNPVHQQWRELDQDHHRVHHHVPQRPVPGHVRSAGLSVQQLFQLILHLQPISAQLGQPCRPRGLSGLVRRFQNLSPPNPTAKDQQRQHRRH